MFLCLWCNLEGEKICAIYTTSTHSIKLLNFPIVLKSQDMVVHEANKNMPSYSCYTVEILQWSSKDFIF